MADWADRFFVQWQAAWGTGTEAVLEYVTDDIEYWDPTLPEPIHGRDAYAAHCDNLFTAFTECEWSMREPVICEGDRVTEPGDGVVGDRPQAGGDGVGVVDAVVDRRGGQLGQRLVEWCIGNNDR